jgi:hypothetical protein
MTTQNQTYSDDERMKREELQTTEQERERNDRGYREVRDEDVIDTRAEEVEEVSEVGETTTPLITPAAPGVTETKRVDQSAAPVEGQRVPNAGFGTPHADEGGPEATERWQRIQAEFVDDPRKAVGEAHELVGETVQRIVDAFTKERNDLESEWSKGNDVSTEDLRVCLQHYRAFFSRLSPTVNGTQHS